MSIPSLNKKKINPLLLKVLIISAAAHVLFLIVFGGYRVYQHVQRADPQFEEAPTIAQVDTPPPPPQEVEVVIQRPQHTQVQPTSMRSLRVQQVGNIAVAAVTADVPNMQESFAVGGGSGALAGGLAGAGGGLSIGEASGNIGLGMSELNVFGITDKGERILFIIDAGRNMLLDTKGGMNSYNIIKQEVARLVESLSAGTLYNVMIYEFDSTLGAKMALFQNSLVRATPANLERLKTWLAPVNRDAKALGVRTPNIRPTLTTDTDIGKIFRGQSGRVTRNDVNSHHFVTQVALEQNVDLVYVITSEWAGINRMARPLTDRENAAWEQRVASAPYQRQLAEHMKERADMDKKVAELEREANEERRKKGQPPIVWRHGWISEKMNYFKLKFTVNHPGSHASAEYIDARHVQNHFATYIKENYTDKRQPAPRFNFIVFLSENENLSVTQRNTMRDTSRFLGGGRFRELKGLPAIQSHMQQGAGAAR